MSRLLLPAVLLFAVASCPAAYAPAQGQEKPKADSAKKVDSASAIKWDLGNLEKHLDSEFGVKFKSGALVDAVDTKGNSFKKVKALFEYTKDIDEKARGEMRMLFNDNLRPVGFLLFDEENVLFGTLTQVWVDGDTGVKGDAFRVFACVPGNSKLVIPFERTKRVALRIPPKTAEDQGKDRADEKKQ